MSSTVGSSAADRSAEIDRCLSLISPSQPDESKFVGMLLLPRLLQHDQKETVRRVFDGMNFKFLERLLRSSTDGSGNEQVPDHVLKEIAVNVLGCFARYEDMVSSKTMVDRIPALSLVLTANDQTDTTKESLNILLCVTVSKEGLVKVLDPDVLKNIFELIVATNQDQELKLATQLITATYARTCNMLHEKSIPSLNSALKYSLQTTFSALSKILKLNQDKLKFQALDLLARILPDIPSEVMNKFKNENEENLNKWLPELRSGLREIISSKIDYKYRDQSMVVVACLLRYFGPDWLFSSLRTKSSRRRQKEKMTAESEAETKFPTLVVHLVAAETRVMLDDIYDKRMNLHNQATVKVDESKEKRQQTMIPVCFEILEAAIHFLSTNYAEERESGMDAEVLLKIRKALNDTMNVVMELLKFIQDTTDNEDTLENDLIAQASMRIVAVYLAEEGYEL